MSSTIQYCESCRGRISAADLDAGRAMRFRDGIYCPACRHELSAMLGAAEAPPSPAVAGGSPARPALPSPKAPKVWAAKPELEPRVRSVGSPPRSAIGPVPMAIGGAITLIAVVILATGRGEPPIAAPPVVPPAKPGAGPPVDPVDPQARLLEDLRVTIGRFPEQYPEHLERARTLRDTLRSPALLAALAELERGVEQHRERAAQERFDQLLRETHALITQDQHDPAIDRWGEFGDHLLTPAWRLRVESEVAKLTALRDAAVRPEPTPRPVPPAPTPTPLRPPEPRPDRVQSVFDGRTSAGWTLSDLSQWTIADGVLSGKAGDKAAFALTGDPAGSAYVLRFELRRSVGHTYLRYHWTDAGEVYGLNLPTTGGTAHADTWTACVAVIRKVETVTYFMRDGHVAGAPFHQRFAAGAGRVGVILGANASIELRAISIEPLD